MDVEMDFLKCWRNGKRAFRLIDFIMGNLLRRIGRLEYKTIDFIIHINICRVLLYIENK